MILGDLIGQVGDLPLELRAFIGGALSLEEV